MHPKKASVSGCFEMPHSGHVRFLEEAATCGEVHPGLGSDRTIVELKGRASVNTQAEREDWPGKITSLHDDKILRWLERHLYLVPLDPREGDFDVFKQRDLTQPKVAALAGAADACWQAILKLDVRDFGRRMRELFEAQVALFPHMSNPAIQAMIEQYAPRVLGWKLSGAGGGGYLVLVAEQPLDGILTLTIRRKIF